MAEKINKEEIEKQAKQILNKFSKALQEVKVEEARVERDEDRREEEKKEGEDKGREEGGKETDDFRKIMLKNALKKTKDCIEAEKGGWVE